MYLKRVEFKVILWCSFLWWLELFYTAQKSWHIHLYAYTANSGKNILVTLLSACTVFHETFRCSWWVVVVCLNKCKLFEFRIFFNSKTNDHNFRNSLYICYCINEKCWKCWKTFLKNLILNWKYLFLLLI